MPLNSKKIENFLNHQIPVRVFCSVDSTNNEAKRRAAEDRGQYVLYTADSQSAGRGRRGHSFYSPASGLYMTLSLPIADADDNIQLLTCAAAVAVCEAVAALTGLSPVIKWVNDVYVSGRKVAGILSEMITDDKNVPIAVIIGIGVNLTTEEFPDGFADNAGSIGDIDANLLCAKITDLLIDWYTGCDNNSALEKYRSLNFCIGRRVHYADQDGDHTATAVDIAEDGSLIVEENGKKRSLHSGEISIKV